MVMKILSVFINYFFINFIIYYIVVFFSAASRIGYKITLVILRNMYTCPYLVANVVASGNDNFLALYKINEYTYLYLNITLIS